MTCTTRSAWRSTWECRTRGELRTAVRRNCVPAIRSGVSRRRTPIPCTHCNNHVKFDPLLGDFRPRSEPTAWRPATTPEFAAMNLPGVTIAARRGGAKDQTYFSVWFEPGADVADRIFLSANSTRALCGKLRAQASLPGGGKGRSQEFASCRGNYVHLSRRIFLGNEAKRSGGRRRPRNDQAAKSSGGIAECTITTVGQRKGLGHRPREDRSTSSNLTAPSNRVVVAMMWSCVRVLRSTRRQLDSFAVLEAPVRRDGEIRHRHEPAPATIEPIDATSARVKLIWRSARLPRDSRGVLFGDVVLRGDGSG